MIKLAAVQALLDALEKKRHYGTVQLVFECGQVKFIRSEEVWKEEDVMKRV